MARWCTAGWLKTVFGTWYGKLGTTFREEYAYGFVQHS